MVLTDVRNLLFYWDLFSGVEMLASQKGSNFS